MLGRSAWSFGAIPIIYIFATLVRAACVVLFNPLFKLLGAGELENGPELKRNLGQK